MMAYFRNNPPVIEGKKLISYDDIQKGIRIKGHHQTKLDYPISNVLKFDFSDDTWIVMRPSGTEPKIKIYYGTKAETFEAAKAFVHQLSDSIQKKIESI